MSKIREVLKMDGEDLLEKDEKTQRIFSKIVTSLHCQRFKIIRPKRS